MASGVGGEQVMYLLFLKMADEGDSPLEAMAL